MGENFHEYAISFSRDTSQIVKKCAILQLASCLINARALPTYPYNM